MGQKGTKGLGIYGIGGSVSVQGMRKGVVYFGYTWGYQ